MDFKCSLSDPQAQLSNALVKGDIRHFRAALDLGARPMEADEQHLSVFEKALSTQGCGAFVEECLRRGCNANFVNAHLNRSAINYASSSRDPRIIAALLSQPDVLVDRKYAQLTPLNSLAKNLNSENFENVFTCIELLLNYGATPNIPDQREMTPLHYILKNNKISLVQKRELVALFLRDKHIDLDTYRNGELRQLLETQFPDMPLPDKCDQKVTFNALIQKLRNGAETVFIEQYAEFEKSATPTTTGESKLLTEQQKVMLLMESIKYGAHAAFDLLLQHGTDINMQLEGTKYPIKTAVIWGNFRSLELLLKNVDLKLPKKAQLLHYTINKIGEHSVDEFCNYTRCFELLLDSAHIDINEKDCRDLTPLHYAVQYRNTAVIQALLRNGAYIGIRSKLGNLPIEDMSSELLEQHFDNCLQTNELKPGDENFEIILNYMNLMRNETEQHSHLNLSDEMAPLVYMAESKEHRHLLQHPLITSFLFLKWHRLSVLFYINFLCFTLFALSIIVHTLLKFQKARNVALLTLFGICSQIGVGYMILREFVQMAISPRHYFSSVTNYMEILLIILAIFNCNATSYDDNETQRVIAVFTMLLVALELCLLVGSLPVLSISTHMLMLRAVSHSFLKSFTLYSIFLVTFSLCFYLLFGKPEANKEQTKNNTENEVDDGDEFNKFSSPFTAVIKTIVMMTGEFDAGDIDFNTLSSYIVFLLFVVFMSVILLNLLNGLAVSDTQFIKSQAEINGSICRTMVLARYEAVFSGRSSTFMLNHEPFCSLYRRLLNIYPNYITGRQIAILPNDYNKVLIPLTNTWRQTKRSSGEQITDHNSSTKLNIQLPLKQKKTGINEEKLLDPPIQFLPCCCSWFTGKCTVMDSRTVRLALDVLDKKANNILSKKRQEKTEKRLEQIEDKLNQLIKLYHEQK